MAQPGLVLADVVRLVPKSFQFCWGDGFLGLLARQRRLLLEFFLLVPISLSGLPASLAPSLGKMRQKENPGDSPPCCSSSPKFHSQSPFFYLSESSYVVFHVTSSMTVVLRRKNGERDMYSIFLEAGASKCQFNKWS